MIPTSIPRVKPTVMVFEINLIRSSKCNKPMPMSIRPAKKVATVRPARLPPKKGNEKTNYNSCIKILLWIDPRSNR